MAGGAIANLHARLSWDLNDFDRGTAHIGGVFGKLRTMALALADSITGAFKGMTIGITAPFAALSIFSIKAASDAAELQSAFDQVFGNLSDGMNKWAENTGNQLGRATQTMQESAKQFQTLFSKALDPAAAAEMSKQFTILAEDVDSFFNLASGDGRAKLFSGLTGESEPLKALGVFMNESAVKAKALELGLGGVKRELTDQEKIMARAAIIREQLAAADGDVIRTSDGLANSWRKLKETVTELRVEFGQRFMQIAERIVGWAQSMLEKIQALPDWVKDAAIKFGVFAAALGPVMLVISTIAITLLPLFLARLNPIFFIISAILNPLGTAVVTLWSFAGGLAGITAKLAPLFGSAGLAGLGRLFLWLLGPIGRVIAIIVLFKDNIISAFSAVWTMAQETLGPPLQELFQRLGQIADDIGAAFDALAESEIGKFLKFAMEQIGLLIELLIRLGGSIVIGAIEGLIEAVNGIAEYVEGVVETVRRVLEGDWAGAWNSAANVVGNALARIASWIQTIFPGLSALLNIMAQLVGTSNTLNGNFAQSSIDNIKSGAYIGGAEGLWSLASQELADKTKKPSGVSGSGIPKSGGGRSARGASGPSKEELEDRREEIRLAQALAVAREKGDLEAERALQRQIDLRSKIDRYVNAGLSKDLARKAAEKDMAELDQARAVASAKALASDERSFDMQLAELRGDYEHLKVLEDQEFIEAEILRMTKEGVDADKAALDAKNRLFVLEEARADKIAARLADQERVRQIELARIRGDDPDRIRGMEENLRRGDRYAELRDSGYSEEDAIAQATREGMDRSRAHLQGTFRDTFRDGLRAAMDSNLGNFIENFWKDKLFNVFANVLDHFADGLANILSGSKGSGGGGLGSVIGGLLGGGGFNLDFLGGNTASSIGAQSVGALQSTFVPGFANEGSFRIKGFSGVDQNLLSLNGAPIARVSSGEIMDVRKGSSGGGGDTHVHQQFHFAGGVDLATRSEVYRVGEAAKMAALAALGDAQMRSG